MHKTVGLTEATVVKTGIANTTSPQPRANAHRHCEARQSLIRAVTKHQIARIARQPKLFCDAFIPKVLKDS